MILTKGDIDFAKAIAEEVIYYHGETDFLSYDDAFTEEISNFELFLKDRKIKADIRNGVSKAVIVPWDKDFVIKISFADIDDDYVKIEEYKFKQAKGTPWKKFFADVVFLMEDKDYGITVVLQSKVKILGVNADDIEYRTKEEAEEMQSLIDVLHRNHMVGLGSHLHFCPRLAERLILEIGEESFVEFLEFLENNRMNDIHNENWGIDDDGNVVIFDYSGFKTDSMLEESAI